MIPAKRILLYLFCHDQEVHERIVRWLYTIHLRAPGTTVILVANKCDTIPISDVKRTVQRVEKRVKEDLKVWKNKRGANHQDVKLLERSFPVSCENYDGIPDLRKQIMQQGATEIYVPPSWDLALNFIGELKSLNSPTNVARGNLGLLSTAAVEGTDLSGPFITMEKLSDHWSKKAGDGMDSALEGALWIRCVDHKLLGALLIRVPQKCYIFQNEDFDSSSSFCTNRQTIGASRRDQLNVIFPLARLLKLFKRGN